MTYDPDKHQRRSVRLIGYDYSQAGAYFITVCTYRREMIFGDVIDKQVRLSTCGEIAAAHWQEIALHIEGVTLDSYVIMPNHIHGVLWINNGVSRGTRSRGYAPDLQYRTPATEQFGKPVRGSLPTIIRTYKAAVTRQMNRCSDKLKPIMWQRNYYEHVIRDEDDLARIRAYIENNPADWLLDENHPSKL